MTIDLARARADTAGVEHVLHLNNAGSSLPPRQVTDAIIGHIALEARIGGYEACEAREANVERTYEALASLLICHPDEIAILDSATRAWDMAFYAQSLRSGARILTTRSEYSSNFIAFLHAGRRIGATVEVIPDDETGQTSAAALENLIDKDVKLIAVTHVPTSGGLVNPVAAIGRVARQAGIPYLVDACQSCGQMPIDVEEIGCDMLSGTGRKYLRGPRGTGFLYVRKDFLATLDPPFLDDHSATWTAPDCYEVREDARKFETWESNVAGKIGLGVAVDYALGWGLPAIYERILALAERLRAALAEIATVVIHDQGVRPCGIVTFSVGGIAAEGVMRALRTRQINVTVSTRASTLIDMTARRLESIVRASVHYFNSEEEIDVFAVAVHGVARRAA